MRVTCQTFISVPLAMLKLVKSAAGTNPLVQAGSHLDTKKSLGVPSLSVVLPREGSNGAVSRDVVFVKLNGGLKIFSKNVLGAAHTLIQGTLPRILVSLTSAFVIPGCSIHASLSI